MAYDDTNKGAMFKNVDKDTEKHPDYKGKINVDGVDYWISGWIKKAGPNAQNPGMNYMSLAVNKVEPRENRSSIGSRPPDPELDDDIPF